MMNAEPSNNTGRLKNRRGAMLAFTAVALVGFLGLLAIVIDIGSGNRERRIAQIAADAGAIGGGRQIERNLDSASVATYAMYSTQLNGFSNAETIVRYPPTTGSHIGDLQYVEVLVGKRIPTFFGRILNRDSIDIQARAVAGMGVPSHFCIINLAGAGTGIDWDGNMTTNCGVVSNAGVYLKKGIDGNPPPDVSAVGTVTGGRISNSFSGIPPVPDPFKGLVGPAETSCDHYNKVVTADETLNPGVYCGGIWVNDNIRATLTPGTYVVRGGGIRGGQIEGWGGVTLINTNGPGNDQSAYRPITMGNNCLVHIQAPSSGPYQGVAVLIDSLAPESATSSDYVNDLCGKGVNTPCDQITVDVEGLVYMPRQSFNIGNSNAKFTISGILISKYMTSHSGAELCAFQNSTSTSPLLKLVLVE